MPDPKEDAVTARATALLAQVNKILTTPSNGVNQLNTEMRALSEALARVPKWLARVGAATDRRNVAEVSLIHLESAMKSLADIPQSGTDLTDQSNALRPRLTGALSQLLLFGVLAVEKDSGEIAVLEGAVNAALAAQKKEYDSVIAEARAALEAAKKAAEKATESARKVGVTVHMTAFSVARVRHRKSANCWAVLTAAVAVLLLGCALYEINFGDGPPDAKGSWYVAGNLSHYLARGLSVSLISYLLVFCTKNFRSSKHNEVVNAHRAGALATFDTLKSGNDRVDEAIILQVAEAVFTAQPTGYDGNETSGTHLTELISSVNELRK